MQRLLEDAEKISGVEYDLSSFADITQAIHVMQEEMGIAGATALEAETTISGSAASMKAAWQNLVAGLGDENANVEALLDTFIESVVTWGGNIIPVVKKILGNIGKTLKENGPEMLANGVLMLAEFVAGLIQGIPDMVMKIPEIVKAIVNAFKDNKDEFLAIGEDVVRGVWDGIQKMASWIAEKVRGFFDDVADEAKATLGIASPSKVFASIGGYMAEGVGVGWDDEFTSVRDRINNGLQFGTGSVDFASSGMGIASAGIINAASGSRVTSGFGGPIELVLKSEDGQTFGRWLVPFTRSENRSNPEVVSDA